MDAGKWKYFLHKPTDPNVVASLFRLEQERFPRSADIVSSTLNSYLQHGRLDRAVYASPIVPTRLASLAKRFPVTTGSTV